MSKIHDIGPYYGHVLRYPVPRAPRWERATTNEIEEPYRAGAGLVIRIGPRLAIVLGKWRHTGRTEEEALLAALGASPLAGELDADDDLVVAGTKLRGWPGGSMGEAQQGDARDAGDAGEADSATPDG